MAILPTSAWCQVFSFCEVRTLAAYDQCCKSQHDRIVRMQLELRLSAAQTSVESAATNLCCMLLSPSERGMLPTLVKSLRDVARQCLVEEQQWRNCLSEGRYPEPPVSIHLQAEEYAFAFLLLMILLTDVRRRPSTRSPYVAAAQLRKLTPVADAIDDAFLVKLVEAASILKVEEIGAARSELVSALRSLSSVGTVVADSIHELFREFSTESDVVKVAILQVLPLHCGHMSRAITTRDIALNVSDPADTVWRAAMACLAQLGKHSEIVSILVTILNSRSENREKREALDAISHLDSFGMDIAPAIGPIVMILDDDRSEAPTRIKAAKTLGELTSIGTFWEPSQACLEVISALRRTSSENASEPMRAVARESLRKLGFIDFYG